MPLLGHVLALGANLGALAVALPVTLLTVGVAWVLVRPLTGLVLLSLAAGLFLGLRRAGGNAAAGAPAPPSGREDRSDD